MTRRLVKVVWHDAEDPAVIDGKAWMSEDEVEAFSGENCEVTSIGYLMSHTSKYITLAADVIDSIGHCGRVTKIPAGMMTAMTDLKDAE